MGDIAIRTIRDRRRSLAWWCFGILLYAGFVAAFWPFIADQQAELTAVIMVMPKALIAMFGLDNPAEMFSPAGYLTTRSFGWIVPVVLAIYAAALGAALIAGEEEDGTLELLLANPVSRARVVLEKWLALAAINLVLGLALFATAFGFDRVFGLGVAVDRYAAVTLQVTLLGLLFGSIALAAGAAGASRAVALGIVAALAVAGFLINSLAGLVDWLAPVQRLSPFFYYDANRPLMNGFDLPNAAILAAASVVVVLLAIVAFRRRDVGV